MRSPAPHVPLRYVSMVPLWKRPFIDLRRIDPIDPFYRQPSVRSCEREGVAAVGAPR